MPITILCPQCSAKYNLRRERVALGIKRALCYCCHAEFDIEDAVLELLGMAPETSSSSVQPPAIAAEPDAPSPTDVQMAELSDTEQTDLNSSGPGKRDYDEDLIELPAIQIDDLEAEAANYDGQPPLPDLPGPIEDLPDPVDGLRPAPQTDGLAAAEADDIPLPQIQNVADDLPGYAPLALGEIGVEIESSDLIFDTEEDIPAQSSVETDSADTLDLDADGQSDISAMPSEDGDMPPASEAQANGSVDVDTSNEPFQLEIEPIDDDALSGLPATIEHPDESSDAPIAALGQEEEALDVQDAAQPSAFSDDEADVPVQVSSAEKPELGVEPETEGQKFDVGDFVDAPAPGTDEEEAGAISVLLDEDDDVSALESPGASQTEPQQEQIFAEEQALPSDAAPLSNFEILDAQTPSVSMTNPAEPEDVAQPGVVPLDAPTGEGLSALAGSGLYNIFDSLQDDEIAPIDETERPEEGAGQVEEPPTQQPSEPPLEPAPTATNESAKIKVRMGDDLIENLTIEEVAAMVEDRRLLEDHYIARQFSENWIAAALVPALRPVFEKVRAEKVRFDAPPPPPAHGAKRGLFNGLFGRN